MTTVAALEFTDRIQAERMASSLDSAMMTVVDKQVNIVDEKPPAPYDTLAMIEDASRLLGWSSRKIMAEAQSLFENGLITYPRSDSTEIDAEAVSAIRDVIVQLYGTDALPKEKNPWQTLKERIRGTGSDDEAGVPEKAHEAIRPADPAVIPDTLVATGNDAHRLYKMIWQRCLASQMRPARYKIIDVVFQAGGG